MNLIQPIHLTKLFFKTFLKPTPNHKRTLVNVFVDVFTKRLEKIATIIISIVVIKT